MREIRLNGKIYRFPDDATDEEILRELGAAVGTTRECPSGRTWRW
jgi:hypothetical protein